MSLHGAFGKTEPRGGLFVQQASNHAHHYFTFTIAEGVKSDSEIVPTLFFAALGTIALQCHLDGVEHVLLPQRFCKKFDRACLHCSNRHRNVPMTCNKDYRDSVPRIGQFLLKV